MTTTRRVCPGRSGAARRSRSPAIAGSSRYLRYGERWTCEKCGKTWNTKRIPVEQYAAIRATQLRYRRVPIIISVFALAAVIACILVGKAVGGLL